MVCVRPGFHNDPKLSVSLHRLQWDLDLSLKKKKKKKGESEVILLCGQGIWINSFLLINSCEMELTQVYAANLSSIQQNMQKDAARPACVEILWHLRRKKHP